MIRQCTNYVLSAGVGTLIDSSKRGCITSAEYSLAYEAIRDTVQKGFYMNGTLMLTMLSNTAAGNVMLTISVDTAC